MSNHEQILPKNVIVVYISHWVALRKSLNELKEENKKLKAQVAKLTDQHNSTTAVTGSVCIVQAIGENLR